MIRRMVFIPMSATCFLGSYVAYNIGKIPGFDKEKCELTAVGFGALGAGTAWLGLKPSKHKCHDKCPDCGDSL